MVTWKLTTLILFNNSESQAEIFEVHLQVQRYFFFFSQQIH